MADIRLVQPSNGQRVTVASEENARLVFDFPADQVTMSRADGSNDLQGEHAGV